MLSQSAPASRVEHVPADEGLFRSTLDAHVRNDSPGAMRAADDGEGDGAVTPRVPVLLPGSLARRVAARPMFEVVGRKDRPPRNRLLSALSAADHAEIRPHLEMVELEQGVLFAPGEPISHVYFPETAVVSLVSHLEEGGTVEVGTAGCEGMVGLPVFLGDDSSSVLAFAQIPGVATRVGVAAFTRLASARSALHRLMLRYTQAFLTQVAQTAVCNGAHLVEQRCARWLLMTYDRVNGDDLLLTHEFLASMLGVRRAGVTAALRSLQDAGLVDCSRGRVRIVDRARLADASCECYRVVRAHFERLLSRSA